MCSSMYKEAYVYPGYLPTHNEHTKRNHSDKIVLIGFRVSANIGKYKRFLMYLYSGL